MGRGYNSLMQGAWKVGLLVVAFAALFMGAYAILGRSVFAPKTSTYYADFADAGGVTVGSRVLLAGVHVGQVADVRLLDGRKARLELQVSEEVEIPSGTVAVLPTALIGIGDRQIELTPPATPSQGALAKGAVLPGRIRSPLEAMIPDSGATIANLNDTLLATQKLLGDEGLKAKIGQLLESGSKTAEQFGRLASRLDGMLVENRASLNAAIRDGAGIVEDLGEVSRALAYYAKSGKLEGQIDVLVAKVGATLDSSVKLVEDMRALASDPAMKANLGSILENTKTMTESGTRMAANGELIAANGVELSKKAIEIADKASALADDAKELMERLKKTVDRLPGPSSFGKIEASADVIRESDPNRWRTELNVAVPWGKQKIHAGLWDAFESNKLNFQLGQGFARGGELRYGVYASKPGVGVEYPLASGLRFRGDLFGVNEPRFDLRAKYEFGNGITGWVGLERIFERNAPSIGIGIRR